MARILLHTLVFAPDGVSTSVLLSELAQDLMTQGHQVVILTTIPHYNRDAAAETKQPLHRRLFGLYYVSEHHNIRVIHTFMPRKGQRVGSRLRDYLIFHILSLVLGVCLIGRQDVVIAASPPLSIGMVGWFLALAKGARFIYNVRELYPALLVQMGMLSPKSSPYRLLYGLEYFVYARSWVVIVISEQFRRHVVGRGIPSEKVVTIPDFVDTEFIRPGSKDNPLARQLGLVDKYVILYAGNIGMTQSFDTIIRAMQCLSDLPQVHFLIVGDGARRSYVEEQIQTLNLQNVTMLPYQPHHVVPDIYATADLGLVPLMAGTAQTTIPSKIYTLLASGRPVLVSVDMDSDLVTIVERARCGIAVPPDDANALEQGIRRAYAERDVFAQYGESGRRYVKNNFSRQAINENYHRLLKDL